MSGIGGGRVGKSSLDLTPKERKYLRDDKVKEYDDEVLQKADAFDIFLDIFNMDGMCISHKQAVYIIYREYLEATIENKLRSGAD